MTQYRILAKWSLSPVASGVMSGQMTLAVAEALMVKNFTGEARADSEKQVANLKEWMNNHHMDRGLRLAEFYLYTKDETGYAFMRIAVIE